jgi:hypothetical protein
MQVHAMAFAIPAWVLGLILGQVAFGLLATYLSSVTGITVSPWLSVPSILIATGLGLVIPIIAALFPIRVR